MYPGVNRYMKKVHRSNRNSTNDQRFFLNQKSTDMRWKTIGKNTITWLNYCEYCEYEESSWKNFFCNSGRDLFRYNFISQV